MRKRTGKRTLAVLLATMLLAVIAMPAASAAEAQCSTKYPIVLVSGAGFTDRNYGLANYWGRIPAALQAQGAKIYYGGTDGWCSVESGAAALKNSVERALKETGAAKVNIVAHSKGGVEARYMISSLGMAGKVASLTTISTPHRGSKAMDMLLGAPDFLFRMISVAGDAVRLVWGDKHPDFYAGTHSLGSQYMKDFNEKNPDMKGVYYQSYAGAMQMPMSDLILALTNLVIRGYDGENDGMVGVESAKWTNFRGVLRGDGISGVSHLDEVDLRRNDVKIQKADNGATDMLGFYVALAADLKQKGY